MRRRNVLTAIRHLRKRIDARILAMEEARALQATEYERRLAELNHAHEAAREAVLLTVPRTLYDADKEAASAKLYAIKDQVTAETTARASADRETVRDLATKRQMITWLVTATLVVGGWVVNWLLRRSAP